MFLRAFQRFEEIGASPTAAGWLKTVTRNACLNHLSRCRARWRLVGEEEAAAGFGRRFASAGVGARRPA